MPENTNNIRVIDRTQSDKTPLIRIFSISKCDTRDPTEITKLIFAAAEQANVTLGEEFELDVQNGSNSIEGGAEALQNAVVDQISENTREQLKDTDLLLQNSEQEKKTNIPDLTESEVRELGYLDENIADRGFEFTPPKRSTKLRLIEGRGDDKRLCFVFDPEGIPLFPGKDINNYIEFTFDKRITEQDSPAIWNHYNQKFFPDQNEKKDVGNTAEQEVSDFCIEQNIFDDNSDLQWGNGSPNRFIEEKIDGESIIVEWMLNEKQEAVFSIPSTKEKNENLSFDGLKGILLGMKENGIAEVEPIQTEDSSEPEEEESMEGLLRVVSENKAESLVKKIPALVDEYNSFFDGAEDNKLVITSDILVDLLGKIENLQSQIRLSKDSIENISFPEGIEGIVRKNLENLSKGITNLQKTCDYIKKGSIKKLTLSTEKFIIENTISQEIQRVPEIEAQKVKIQSIAIDINRQILQADKSKEHANRDIRKLGELTETQNKLMKQLKTLEE